MLDRKDAVKALGMASLLTGVMLASASGKAEAAMGDGMKKMLMSKPGEQGYMTWRKFSEVESRAKDQNKGQVGHQRDQRLVRPPSTKCGCMVRRTSQRFTESLLVYV